MAVSDIHATFQLVLTVSVLVLGVRAQTMPTGCAYYDGLYECNYDTLNSNGLIPLSAASFTPIPQRLRLTNLPTTLSTAIFNANFASISTCEYFSSFLSFIDQGSNLQTSPDIVFYPHRSKANNVSWRNRTFQPIRWLIKYTFFIPADYDTNYPATLELECYPDSTLTLSAGFLANMGHIQEFRIINCQLGTVPASAFSELGSVDRFFIENGTITSMNANMLSGVTAVRNISASPAFPKHWGEIRFLNTKLTGGTFDPAVLASQSNLYSLVLRNMGLTSIDASLLDGCTSIRYLDLSHNDFTSLPSGLFSNLTSLGEILMYGINIDGCTCANLWFLDYVYANMLSFHGDVVCTNTSGWENKLAWNYFYSNCVSYDKDCTDGISMAGSCLTVIDLTGYIVGGIAFILGWVVLGLSIHTMKTINGDGGGGGKGKPKPGAKKKAPKKKSGWA